MTLVRTLFGIVLAVAGTDIVWALAAHFHVDGLAYLRLALLAAGLAAAGIYYQRRRKEPRLAAMLLGASFLIAFSAAASVLNYFLLTVAGPRIDLMLAAMDHRLGFDWPSAMAVMSRHPVLNRILFWAYSAVLPEISVMMVALAWKSAEQTYRFCLAVAAGALIAIFIWALAPSVGTQALYVLPHDVAARLSLAVAADYGHTLNVLLKGDPGYITPSELRGLIAFPSYHGILALLVCWYARQFGRAVFWPVLALNALVLVATPVQGGHHLVDILASFPAAALALLIAAKVPAMVNKSRPFMAIALQTGRFRFVSAQSHPQPAPRD